MMFNAYCHQIFSSSKAFYADTLSDLEATVNMFMEIIQRLNTHILPKFHLLECQAVLSIHHLGVSLGLLDEQVGEHICAIFNLLHINFWTVV